MPLLLRSVLAGQIRFNLFASTNVRDTLLEIFSVCEFQSIYYSLLILQNWTQ